MVIDGLLGKDNPHSSLSLHHTSVASGIEPRVDSESDVLTQSRVCAIFFGVLMFCIVFLVPETAYRRDRVVPVLVSDEVKTGIHMKLGHEHDPQHFEKVVTTHQGSTSSSPKEKRHTFLQSLSVFTGRYSNAPMWKIMLRPVVMWFYPAVLWAFLIYGKLMTH